MPDLEAMALKSLAKKTPNMQCEDPEPFRVSTTCMVYRFYRLTANCQALQTRHIGCTSSEARERALNERVRCFLVHSKVLITS